MKLHKLQNSMFINLDNINYIVISGSYISSKLLEIRGLYGSKPGYMDEGIALADGFKSYEEAEEWIKINLGGYNVFTSM